MDLHPIQGGRRSNTFSCFMFYRNWVELQPHWLLRLGYLTHPQLSLMVERRSVREMRAGEDGKEEEPFSLPSSCRPLHCIAILVSSRPYNIIRDDWGMSQLEYNFTLLLYKGIHNVQCLNTETCLNKCM